MDMDSKFALYKVLLHILNEPAVLTAVGGLILAIGSYFNHTVKGMIKRTIRAIDNYANGPTVSPQDGKQGDKIHDPLTEKMSEQFERIVGQLEELLDTLQCSRVSILQFHNGTRFSLSNPVFKFSTSYEAVAQGFAPSAPRTRELMVSLNTTFINPLMMSAAPAPAGVKRETDFCKQDNKDCPLVDEGLKIISYTQKTLRPGQVRLAMEELGISKMYATLLVVQDKGPVGILLMQYHNDYEADELMRKNICDVCKVKHYLQALLYCP